MKVETPQILWHAEEKNLPAALLSLDVHGTILATAGHGIHLWRMNSSHKSSNSAVTMKSLSSSSSSQPPPPAPPRAEFITALTRHDRPVNRIAFNANHYLASAGDSGDVVIFYAPNWNNITHENDVKYTNAGRAGEAVTDLAWSGDANRLVVCTIDHGVVVVEQQPVQQSQQQQGGGDSSGVNTSESSSSSCNLSFRIVFRSNNWHSHYVQGVTYDPLNLYICTASSDRTVRVAMARTVKKQFQMAKSKPVVGRYVDEGSLKSFCRRLAWTPDGAYLLVPAAHNAVDDTSYATLLFARHRFDEPARILGGLDKVCYVLLLLPGE
jgi:chromatin assembly factor 1 subunit B